MHAPKKPRTPPQLPCQPAKLHWVSNITLCRGEGEILQGPPLAPPIHSPTPNSLPPRRRPRAGPGLSLRASPHLAWPRLLLSPQISERCLKQHRSHCTEGKLRHEAGDGSSPRPCSESVAELEMEPRGLD